MGRLVIHGAAAVGVELKKRRDENENVKPC